MLSNNSPEVAFFFFATACCESSAVLVTNPTPNAITNTAKHCFMGASIAHWT
jgi:hypothetical protein